MNTNMIPIVAVYIRKGRRVLMLFVITALALISVPAAIGKAPVSILSHECLDRQRVFGTTTTIYHGSAVEPTIAVNPKNKKRIVAAWQQDRVSNGAALEAGISYSYDGGRTWRRSEIPLQICKGGVIQRSGDEWLSYAADGSKVYLVAAVLNATQEPNTKDQFGIVVTVSEDDGATWSEPHFLFSSREYVSDPAQQFANSDKSSITADPNNPDRAIAVWSTFNPSRSFHGNSQGTHTTDGGKSWSPVELVYDPFPDLERHSLSNGVREDNHASNNVVVILPEKNKQIRRLNGDWLDFTVRVYARPGSKHSQFTNDTFPFQHSLTDIVMVRSTNYGGTWTDEATLVVPGFVNNLTYTGGYTYDSSGNISAGVGSKMRNDQTLPSYNVNPRNGFLYVAYQTSEFRDDQLPQIGMITSRDGGHTWSERVLISRTPTHAENPQAFGPFVAVTENGRVGVLYFDFRNDDKSDPTRTKMDAWLAIYQEVNPHGGSTGIGLDFVKEIRLSERSYIGQNGPNTTQGFMTAGDYPFLSVQGDDFHAIYTKSFRGPFAPATTFLTDPAHQAVVLLDDNYRTAPFVSVVRNTANGAHLVLTRRLQYKLK